VVSCGLVEERMNVFGTEDRDETAVREERPSLEVLLMYEDFSTGLRARRLLDEVVDSLHLEVDFQAELWRFDLLREPELLNRASDEAARADMVFLSAHGDNPLPPAVHLWLDRWRTRKGSDPCALAVVLDSTPEEAPVRNRIVETLGTFAGPAGVDVFVQTGEESPAGWESAVEDIRRRAETRTELLDEMMRQVELSPYREWGINE
jgi:hypothetical protein